MDCKKICEYCLLYIEFIQVYAAILLYLKALHDQPNLDNSIAVFYPTQPLTTGYEWWYNLPYLKFYSIVTHEPDESLNFSKMTLKPFENINQVPKNFTTQSIVHVTLMPEVFYQREMIVQNGKIIRLFSFAEANFWYPVKRTTRYFDELVHYVQHWTMYGHNIHDFLCAMMFVPKDLMEKGIVVVSPHLFQKITYDIARYLDLNITFVSIKDNEQFFVRKLWIVHTLELAHGYASGGFQKIREIVFKKEDYKYIMPERYVVANRPKKSLRCISDANYLVKILNENTIIEKGSKWIRDDKFYDVPLAEIIKYWMSLKILVTIQGSGIYNSIFMHETTGMVLLFSNVADGPNMQLCSHLHIFMIGVIHPNMQFRNKKPQMTNYTDMVTYTQRVVDAVYHGSWTNLEGVRGYYEPAYPVTNVTYFILNYNEYIRHW
ncbi:hypothetical protein TVAG_361040 [Trichomonas vaginalis G3]|uniref:Glycosyltransferase 61 catalytic domain-containing protein n=1 Tax=Trichomonas vaginalis (strain ATCC PRA-98 / G3) TaxID=412133 RepID=A2G3M7_TRIV3|nr:glycosyltransferase family [Trichomonas vaginalis G3]EAX88236.1 hypothetical protein TVAG_361040 [Trichomonas vaginalis G3]KAI5544911.1 glycosyltransferase family [Trichomonas vaginalis G3]|eukprot:XP_001301166.1 hypothetical protein [Trichomonas vaginalis G3]